jgi:membrane associated rhomboid family serine protease
MRPITERLSPVIKFLIIAEALVYAFYVFADDWRGFIELHLGMSPRLLKGEFWQPLTSQFVHYDPLNFFMNIVGLWWVGATIERDLGTRRFLIVFFVTGAVANLVFAAWCAGTGGWLPVSGCGSSVIALVVVFGTIHDRTHVRVLGGLVLEARIVAAIIAGFAVLVDVAQRIWSILAAHLAAMLLGYLMAGGRGEGLKRLWGSARAKRVRRRYQVLEGGRRGGRPEDLN